MDQGRLLDFIHQHIFQGRTGSPSLTDGLVYHADAQGDAEQFMQKLADAYPRQPHPQRQHGDDRRQVRADEPPF